MSEQEMPVNQESQTITTEVPNPISQVPVMETVPEVKQEVKTEPEKPKEFSIQSEIVPPPIKINQAHKGTHTRTYEIIAKDKSTTIKVSAFVPDSMSITYEELEIKMMQECLHKANVWTEREGYFHHVGGNRYQWIPNG